MMGQRDQKQQVMQSIVLMAKSDSSRAASSSGSSPSSMSDKVGVWCRAEPEDVASALSSALSNSQSHRLKLSEI